MEKGRCRRIATARGQEAFFYSLLTLRPAGGLQWQYNFPMRIRKWFLFGGLFFLLAPAMAAAGAVQLENRDPFCAACHTEPETTFVDRRVQDPVDLASAHAAADDRVRCIDCHSGEGLGGRIGSLYQGALDLAAFVGGDYTQPSVTHNPVGDAGCLKCHEAESPAEPDPGRTLIPNNSHYHLDTYLAEWRQRRRNPAGTCAPCHAAHWDGGLPATGFRNNLLVKTGCEDCHSSLAGWTPPNR
jgi:nitrate/TMAO reductase-like tetraheme cytochrome c subunit